VKPSGPTPAKSSVSSASSRSVSPACSAALHSSRSAWMLSAMKLSFLMCTCGGTSRVGGSAGQQDRGDQGEHADGQGDGEADREGLGQSGRRAGGGERPTSEAR